MFAATQTANTAYWLEELNPEQRAAALHRDGHLLVLAGAGTGKTTTLCARVAALVAGGVPAERILLLTFTRRAARDMLTRAQALATSAGPRGHVSFGGAPLRARARRDARPGIGLRRARRG